jgi:hypothetical protein
VATLPLIVDGELYLLARLSSTSSDKIPKAPSWIQYFGSTAEYFSSLLVCCGLRRNTTRDLETSQKLGTQRAFLQGSGYFAIGGQVVVTHSEEVEGKHFSNSLKSKISRGKDLSGTLSTPIFVHDFLKESFCQGSGLVLVSVRGQRNRKVHCR